jgi:hypothetical protein
VRYVTDSGLLVGGFLFALGALAFAAGSVAGVVARPTDIEALIYLAASVYLTPACGMMWFGTTPDALCANGGRGTCYALSHARATFGDGCCAAIDADKHLANDSLAGAWAFALFMLLDVGYTLIDLLVEPNMRSALAVVVCAPFAIGALVITLSSYPDSLNRPAPWADDEGISDELLARDGSLGEKAAEASGGGTTELV